MAEQNLRLRLSNAYSKLCKSSLVTRKDTCDDSLESFVECLNEALPRDENEHAQVRIVKDLYHNAPNLTYRTITAERDGMTKQACYVLWTNAWCIRRHLHIEELVHLDWDQQNTKYKIRLTTPDDVTAVPVKNQSRSKYVPAQDEWQTKTKYKPPREKKYGTRRANVKRSRDIKSPHPEPAVEPVLTPKLESTKQVQKSATNKDAWE
jgi:hypothetical protein